MDKFLKELQGAYSAILQLSLAWEQLDSPERARVDSLPWDRAFCMSMDEIPYTLARFADELNNYKLGGK
jgi:hypothetical protein